MVAPLGFFAYKTVYKIALLLITEKPYRMLFFAGLAVGGDSGQVPHAGVPEIVTCPLPPPTDCGEQFFR
jgi:hypothetical protein